MGGGWGCSDRASRRRGIAGLRSRPCAPLVPNPALSGPKAQRTGAAPTDPTVGPVCPSW